MEGCAPCSVRSRPAFQKEHVPPGSRDAASQAELEPLRETVRVCIMISCWILGDIHGFWINLNGEDHLYLIGSGFRIDSRGVCMTGDQCPDVFGCWDTWDIMD